MSGLCLEFENNKVMFGSGKVTRKEIFVRKMIFGYSTFFFIENHI